MKRIKKDVPPATKHCVGLREDFIDFNIVKVKSEPIEDIDNDANNSTNDPLLIDASAISVKEEPPSTERKFYGRISLEIDDNGTHIYQLICDKCTTAFATLEIFDEHISENYLNKSKEHTSRQNDIIAEVNEIKVENTESSPNEKSTKNTRKKSDEVKQNEHANVSGRNSPSDLSISAVEDETYEPTVKKRKTICSRSKTISFDYPDKNCVTFFLELLKTHAILWLRKHSSTKPFTTASNTFITEFKVKFSHYNMTRLKLQKGVVRIKSSYERANSTNINKDTDSEIAVFKKKYSEFLKLCNEIDENSKQIEKNCDLCKAVFYSSQELQIHKFKMHKIGELPYKCKLCGYGFAAPETLASHEQKHNRVKSFKFEIRGYASHLESKLFEHHAIMHSNDRNKICEVCGFVCTDTKRFYQHKRAHEQKEEKCSVCGKCFHEKRQLTNHMKAHQNERTYVCNICGKGFNRQKNMYIHKRCVHKMKNIRPWTQKNSNCNYDDKNSDTDESQDISSSTSAANHSKELLSAKMHNGNVQLLPLEVLNTIFS